MNLITNGWVECPIAQQWEFGITRVCIQDACVKCKSKIEFIPTHPYMYMHCKYNRKVKNEQNLSDMGIEPKVRGCEVAEVVQRVEYVGEDSVRTSCAERCS